MNNHDKHSTEPLAEAEVKLEINKVEFLTIQKRLQAIGYVSNDEEILRDYFLEYKVSPHGGWDLRRLRKINNETYFLTQKKWVLDKAGIKVRSENENELEKEAANKLLQEYKSSPFVDKRRLTFINEADENSPYTVALDALEINEHHYYFVECELLTTLDQASAAREKIFSFLWEALEITEREEAPGILDFVKSKIPF